MAEKGVNVKHYAVHLMGDNQDINTTEDDARPLP